MPAFNLMLPMVLAYIDPSTGGLLFQVLAMALAAVSGTLLFFSRQIKASVARLKRFVNERLPRS